MSRAAASITELGRGLFPGDEGDLVFGGERYHVYWLPGGTLGAPEPGVWVTDPIDAIEMRDLDAMKNGFVIPNTDERYLFQEVSGSKTAYGWQPTWLLRPDLARDAGLILQESLDAVLQLFNTSDIFYFDLVSYSLQPPNDQISQLAIPIHSGANQNVGTRLTVSGALGIRAYSSGWQISPIDSSNFKKVLAPHFYTQWSGTGVNDGIHVYYASAKYRFYGVPA